VLPGISVTVGPAEVPPEDPADVPPVEPLGRVEENDQSSLLKERLPLE